MHVENLFPTPVGFFKLDRELFKDEVDAVKELSVHRNIGNLTSYDHYLFRDNDKLSSIKDFVNYSLDQYFSEIYKPMFDTECYVTQSWANITRKDEYHHKHYHPNSFISGVFYVEADRELDKIEFFDDTPYTLRVQSENYNRWNAVSWWFPVGTGDLIFFPSRLSHNVSRIDTDRTRISIAFNTFLKGRLGIDHDLTELTL